MNHQEIRGRRLLIAIIATTLAIGLILIGFQAYVGRLGTSSLIRTGIEVGLLYQLWRGQRWARWLMTFLFAVGGTYGVLYGLKFGLPAAIPLVLMGGLYYTFAILLSWSQDVRAFLLAKDQTPSKPPFDADFA